MYNLKRLKIKGFRGYTKEQEFNFDNPVVLLFGDNHLGKSSTLNAIEWCLFGNECATKGATGIEERSDWEIPNRNSEDTVVEMELVNDGTGEVITLLRRWLSKNKDELQLSLPSGEFISGEEASKKFIQLFKINIIDFMTTIYQHQDAIRAVLTKEPRKRNEAIDRLLGLYKYRDIISGVKKANISKELRNMSEKFDNFKDIINSMKEVREKDLREKMDVAKSKGLDEEKMCSVGILELAEEVKREMSNFAKELNLVPSDLQVPNNWKDLEKFKESTEKEIKRLRSEMPDVKEQERLYKYQSIITEAKTNYEETLKTQKKTKNELEIFIKSNGDGESLKKEINKIDEEISIKSDILKRKSEKGQLINNSIEFLKKEDVDNNICPVCEKTTPNLLEHLRKRWKEEFEEQVGKVQEEIDILKSKLKGKKELLEKYISLEEEFEKNKKKVEKNAKRIGETLEMEITDRDDPVVIAEGKLEEIKKELKELEKSVEEKQENLDKIGLKVNNIQLIEDILNLKEKRDFADRIYETKEFKRLEELIDEMSGLSRSVDTEIINAIKESSHEESKEKVNIASTRIDNFFRKISDNPSFEEIKFLVDMDPKGYNSYEFIDQKGKKLTPILSQGDLNALALSIFLGLSSSAEINAIFGFSILDDPSQSLGLGHKKRFIEILNEVLNKRRLIISSMDSELQELIGSQITKLKIKYNFSDWSPNMGPIVNEE